MTTFWEKLMGRSDSMDSEAARLRNMSAQKARALCDEDCGCDFMDKRHHDYAVRHERRVLHNAVGFWANSEAEHPTTLLQDQTVAMGRATAKDRKGSREHDIRCLESVTLADMT